MMVCFIDCDVSIGMGAGRPVGGATTPPDELLWQPTAVLPDGLPTRSLDVTVMHRTCLCGRRLLPPVSAASYNSNNEHCTTYCTLECTARATYVYVHVHVCTVYATPYRHVGLHSLPFG